MSNYSALKTTINTNIKTNGNQEITGAVLNSVLTAMVNTLGEGYQYKGVATTSTNPGTTDARVFYLAATAGTYTNFGGIVLAEGEAAVLKYAGSWSKDVVGFATKENIDELTSALMGLSNCSGGFGIAMGCFNTSKKFVNSTSGVTYSSYIYPVEGLKKVAAFAWGATGNNRFWLVKSYPVVNSYADFCAGITAPTDFQGSVVIDIPSDAKYLVLGRVYSTTGTAHPYPTIYVYGDGAKNYHPSDAVNGFLNLNYLSNALGGCLVADTTRVVTNPIYNRGKVRITAQLGYRIDKIIYFNGDGIAQADDINLNSTIVNCSETTGMKPMRGEFDKFVVVLKKPDGADIDSTTIHPTGVVGVSTDDGLLENVPFERCDLEETDIFGSPIAAWRYTDYDEIDINLKFKTSSNICVRVVGYQKNGRTNSAFQCFNNSSWLGDGVDAPAGTCVSCNLLKGKKYQSAAGYLYTLDFVVLRFINADGTIPTAAQVMAGLEINEINRKIIRSTPKADNGEMEIPFGGIKAVSDYIVRSDDFMIPRERGTFRVVIPRYMSFEWYAGYNSKLNMNAVSVDGSTTLMKDDTFSFIADAAKKTIQRIQFKIIGSSRAFSVDYVKDLISNGEIKLFISGVGSDVYERNHIGERYANALESDSGRQYGLRDLPMIVHVGDVHSDAVRFKNAFDYAKYLNAHLFIHTGDAPHRAYADSGVDYLKDIDSQVQPTPLGDADIPFLNVIGNHDAWESANYANVVGSLVDPFADKYGYQRVAGKSYYYKDIQVQNQRQQSSSTPVYSHIRIIVLDMSEGLNVQNKWNISQDQIDWFIDTLGATPAGYGVMVALHCPPDSLVKPSEVEDFTLLYKDDTFVCRDQFKKYSESTSANPNALLAYGFLGNPIVKIVDAFISRTMVSDSYQPDSEIATTISYMGDFSSVPASCEFIAYICGHTHRDYVCYAQNAINLQLVLCVTCGTAIYGPYENTQGANSSDVPRGTIGITQDAFNVYVIDHICGRLGIARIGSDIDCEGGKRDIQWLNYRPLTKFWLNDIECYCVEGQTWDEFIGANTDFKNAYAQAFFVKTGTAINKRSDNTIQVGTTRIRLNGNYVGKADTIQASHYTY